MGSVLALSPELSLILKDILASLGFVLQIFRGEGVAYSVPHRLSGSNPLDGLVSGLVRRKTKGDLNPEYNCLIYHSTTLDVKRTKVRVVG